MVWQTATEGSQAIDSTAAEHFRNGIAKLEAGQARDAIVELESATRLDAHEAKYFAQLARALVMAGRTEQAAEAACRALELKPADALSLDTLGVVFSHCGRHELAAETFRQAVQHNPQNAEFRHNLGASLRFAGDLDGARAAFDAALKIDPQMHKVRYARAHLRRYSAAANPIAELQQIFQEFNGAPAERMYLGYALAKELEDCGHFAQAFDVLHDVNSRWKAQSNYDISSDQRIFEALVQAFPVSPQSTGSDSNIAEQPVLIIGLPRTGTTLTERIVSSHQDVYAAGELTHIPRLTRLMSGIKGPAALDPATVLAMAGINARELGQHYIAAVRQQAGDAPRFVDKWPHNFLYVGLILKALPQARIVCVRRNPLDSCLSNFRQLFAAGNSFYNYAYDLLDCGAYYLMFDRLMQHWDELYPGRIYTVHYEQLVTDQEMQSRALIDFCGLQWQDACLQFEKNAAPVATASSVQVREPIYTSALARWKNYRTQLEPLAAFFAANGIDVES